jgi:hypothetical protein
LPVPTLGPWQDWPWVSRRAAADGVARATRPSCGQGSRLDRDSSPWQRTRPRTPPWRPRSALCRSCWCSRRPGSRSCVDRGLQRALRPEQLRRPVLSGPNSAAISWRCPRGVHVEATFRLVPAWIPGALCPMRARSLDRRTLAGGKAAGQEPERRPASVPGPGGRSHDSSIRRPPRSRSVAGR